MRQARSTVNLTHPHAASAERGHRGVPRAARARL